MTDVHLVPEQCSLWSPNSFIWRKVKKMTIKPVGWHRFQSPLVATPGIPDQDGAGAPRSSCRVTQKNRSHRIRIGGSDGSATAPRVTDQARREEVRVRHSPSTVDLDWPAEERRLVRRERIISQPNRTPQFCSEDLRGCFSASHEDRSCAAPFLLDSRVQANRRRKTLCPLS